MAKEASLGVRISSEIKEALDEAAAAERRSTSSLVEIILADWLASNRFLPKQKGRK